MTDMTDLRVESGTQASAEGIKSTEKTNYNVTSSVEICFLLNKILEKKSLLSLYPSSNSHTVILSSILALDRERGRLILDYGINDVLNQLALNRGHMHCITSLDRVRVEFSCEDLRRIRYEERDAFSARIPTVLKRFQRRNFYRIATPIVDPITCSIPLKSHDNLNEKQSFLIFNLLDISCGGMALLNQPKTDTIFKIGMVFE